ncbi:MAG: glycosyltransferase family 9 protein [Flavobacteriaceae bacterium]|nr:glycosyltransferase family 9 protein [Flavobacteriaceae bacterium]
MGDVAMTLPVLKALLNQNKGLKITFVSRPFFEPMFNEIENLNFYPVDLDKKHKGFFGLQKLAKELIKLDIDYIADLHNVLRSNILLSRFKIKGIRQAQIDKGRAQKKRLTHPNKKQFFPLKTTHERYADVFRTLGFNLDLSEVQLNDKKEMTPEIQELFNLPSTHKKIGIAPFAAHKGKEYPMKLMKQVIANLSEEIFLFGGKNDVNVLEKLETEYPNVNSVAGKLTFEQELALISNLDVMVSMDSGNGHLATNFGVPVITIWGVTHPYAGFVPFNQPEENQITADLEKFPLIPTSIYGNKYPEGYLDCFKTIAPEHIIQVIKNALN